MKFKKPFRANSYVYVFEIVCEWATCWKHFFWANLRNGLFSPFTHFKKNVVFLIDADEQQLHRIRNE